MFASARCAGTPPRDEAEALCHGFNTARPWCDAQLDAPRELLGTDLPEELTVLSPVYFDYESKMSFRDGCFVNHGCYFMDGGSITFGDHVFIGPFRGFYTATHPARNEVTSRARKRIWAARL